MNPIHFHWPHLLWLIVIPFAAALAELTRRTRRPQDAHPKILRAEAARGQLSLLTTAPAASPRRRRIRWRLWLGLAFTCVALARPQWGELEEQVFDQSREILIAVDLSRSMLAPDVAPSRLDRAKLLITSLLERMEGERVGLIVFAGTAFLQSPLSADYEILREFLPALDPDFLPEGGTNYVALLQTALDAFSEGSDADRFLIVLSDGESTVEDWEKLTSPLQDRSVKVLTLGVGTAQGAMLPDGSGGFVKDERGAVVLSRLNPSTLEELAQRTGGLYRDASSWVDLASLLEQTVEAGRQGEFSETSRVRRVERFQWALAPALLFLLGSFWREFPVHPRARAVPLAQGPRPSRAAATSRLVAVVLATLCLANSERLAAAEGTGPGGNPFAGPLAETVGRLAGRTALSAPEFAELAQATVTYGQRMLGAQQEPEPGAVNDALAAVAAGERLDPKAADWPRLREQLEAMRPPEPPENPEPQEQEQKNPEEDQQQQSEDGQNDSPQDQSKADQKDADRDAKKQDSPSSGDPSQSENTDQQPGDQSDEAGERSDARPEGQSDSAFGEMNEPPPAATEEERSSGDTQKVGGQSERRPNNENPALTVPLQKLEQLKQQDSPAKLYQLMQDPNARPPVKGRDW